MASPTRHASILLAAIVILAACTGDDGWGTVTVGGPNGCWELSYSAYWIADQPFLDLVRPNEQCPFDNPARRTDANACTGNTGLVRQPLAVVTGRPSGSDGDRPPSASAALASRPLPTPEEHAECVRANGSIQLGTSDSAPLAVEISEVFAQRIASRRAACLDVFVPATDETVRTCWFEVDDYLIRIEGGDYHRHRSEVARFFRDVATSVTLDPGRPCAARTSTIGEPRCG